MSFKIETDVPIPMASANSPFRAVMDELAASALGSSVYVPDGVISMSYARHYLNITYGSGWMAMRKDKIGRGFRIWKTAEPPRKLAK
jgi:hypothetical protein